MAELGETEMGAGELGDGLAWGGPLVLRDDQPPADTLEARDRLITALAGHDVDEQSEVFKELRRLKLRDITQAEAAIAAGRRAGKPDGCPWRRRGP